MTQHIPVLVGLSQILQRTDDPGDAKTPIELMLDAVRAAAEDSGAPDLLARTTSIRVTKGIWGYKNPALEIGEKLGLSRFETGVSALGGNHVQMMLNQSALEIQSGTRDVIVLTGAECGRTMGRAQKAGLEVPWLEEDPQDPLPDPTSSTAPISGRATRPRWHAAFSAQCSTTPSSRSRSGTTEASRPTASRSHLRALG